MVGFAIRLEGVDVLGDVLLGRLRLFVQLSVTSHGILLVDELACRRVVDGIRRVGVDGSGWLPGQV